MAATHTPGPWRVHDPIDNGTAHAICADAGDGVHIVPVAHIEPITSQGCAIKRDDAKQTANANLIAAAPDLLAACKAAEDVISVFNDDGDQRPGALAALEKIHGAIAKAEGGGA